MAKWQYGVILDAGSSGTRLHVYRWLQNGAARKEADWRKLQTLPVVKTKKKWTKKTHPGISTFSDNANLVGPQHLENLFEHARDIVPQESIRETPIFLLATAGVRLLDDLPRKELLKQICKYARSETDFLLPDCDQHIQVISGETEGLYGWIAANYLVGGFDAPEEHDHGKGHHTYGFLDMGGASAQLAFAPNATEAENHSNDLKLLRLRTLNGTSTEYKVFVTTWMGFGAHQARKRYVEKLLDAGGTPGRQIPDPCLPAGLTITTEGDLLVPDTIKGQKVHLLGTGKFIECLKSTKPLLDKEAHCEDPPCLLHGVHVPSIDFDVNHFIGVSEYWHTTHGIFEMSHEDKAYDFHTYQQRVSEFCSENWTTIENDIKAKKWGKKVDEETAAEVCFKASWLINMLHEGIGIPRFGLENTNGTGHNGTKGVLANARSKAFTNAFQAIDKIDDTEVSWTLGRMVLYAASQVPPAKTNVLPVGFGSNVPGVPSDFQYAASRHTSASISNVTREHGSHQATESDIEAETWRDSLFEGNTPRRIPGFLLFVFILGFAIFLLCGRDRRSRIRYKLLPQFSRGNRFSRRRGIFSTKHPLVSSRQPDTSVHERLLESGMSAPGDFELSSVDGESDNEYSDSCGSKTGKASGWATPTSRIAKPKFGDSEFQGLGLGFGSTFTALNRSRSGLLGRFESRE